MERHLLSLAAMNISAALQTLENIGKQYAVTPEESAEMVYQALLDKRSISADDMVELVTGAYRAGAPVAGNGAIADAPAGDGVEADAPATRFDNPRTVSEDVAERSAGRDDVVDGEPLQREVLPAPEAPKT